MSPSNAPQNGSLCLAVTLKTASVTILLLQFIVTANSDARYAVTAAGGLYYEKVDTVGSVCCLRYSPVRPS